MGADVVQVAVTTLASGGLAALGAYVGVIWKLSSRVAKLEETVSTLRSDQEELKTQYSDIKQEFSHKVSLMYEKQDGAKKEIITSIGVLQRDISEFRITCSENRSVMVRKKEFNAFTEEQERRWSEFYRLVGRLEGAMDRLSKAPTLMKNSKNT